MTRQKRLINQNGRVAIIYLKLFSSETTLYRVHCAAVKNANFQPDRTEQCSKWKKYLGNLMKGNAASFIIIMSMTRQRQRASGWIK